MGHPRDGQIAAIFISQRGREDAGGYAAEAMDSLATKQRGYAGIESVRDKSGRGVTISYWADDASTAAWRGHPEHARIRDLGRARGCDWCVLEVMGVERGYRWSRQ